MIDKVQTGEKVNINSTHNQCSECGLFLNQSFTQAGGFAPLSKIQKQQKQFLIEQLFPFNINLQQKKVWYQLRQERTNLKELTTRALKSSITEIDI